MHIKVLEALVKGEIATNTFYSRGPIFLPCLLPLRESQPSLACERGEVNVWLTSRLFDPYSRVWNQA